MTTLKTPPPDVLEYLQAVRATLDDLPPEERDELMVDVETALLEAAEESVRPLALRLGPPQDFAADLRAAAGLQARPDATPAPATTRLRDLIVAAREHPQIVAARRAAGELAPLWWVARGIVAFVALAIALGARTSIAYPWMPVVGGRQTTIAALGLLVAASLALGLRRPARGARVLLGLNLALLLAVVPVALYLGSRPQPLVAPVVITVDAPAQDLTLGGQPIHNLYPYTRDGHRLHDVLLFDDLGRPVNVGASELGSDPNRRVLTTRTGRPALNSFPILYFDPGSRVVAHPNATASPIHVSRIADTPPLRPKQRP